MGTVLIVILIVIFHNGSIIQHCILLCSAVSFDRPSEFDIYYIWVIMSSEAVDIVFQNDIITYSENRNNSFFTETSIGGSNEKQGKKK